MSSPTDRPLRITTPHDLLAYVPYLVGFHPHDSLVVVGLSEAGHRIEVVSRTDRADLRAHTDPVRLEANLVARLLRALLGAGATEALALVYDTPQATPPPAGQLPDRGLVDTFTATAGREGLRVLDALYIAGGRWWSYHCPPADGCPPQGRAVPEPASPAATEATYAGMVALPDRAALAGTLDPLDPTHLTTACTRIQHHLTDLMRGPDRQRWTGVMIGLLHQALEQLTATDQVPWLTEQTVARLVVGLRIIPVRDAAWLWIESTPDRRGPALELWRQLARRAPDTYRVPALFLTAWTAWRCGSGPLANIALQRALTLEPTYSAAGLLDQALRYGINPRTFPPLPPDPGASPIPGTAPTGPV
ncbi:MAG: DUF4192 domain-containing protein [Actinobacteria bacterium]|nr:DUF4192 domain-containing protein [Actinomycetota bacterium]MBI3687405.1 DUF4192 domain-containing protein [Actinomycetota bacterium]